MPSYKVEYTTTDRAFPPLVPAGAKNFKAEKVKVLPAAIKPLHGDPDIQVSNGFCGIAMLTVKTGLSGTYDFCLDAAATDKLIEALQEARKGG